MARWLVYGDVGIPEEGDRRLEEGDRKMRGEACSLKQDNATRIFLVDSSKSSPLSASNKPMLTAICI